MLHDLLEVLWVECAEDVEEVLSARTFVVCVIVLEVLHQLHIILHVLPQVLHRELLVVRDVDIVHRLLLHQLLLTAEDLLEEVLVDLGHWRKIVLY